MRPHRDQVYLGHDCDIKRALIGPPSVGQLLIESIDHAMRTKALPFPVKDRKGVTSANEINKTANEQYCCVPG